MESRPIDAIFKIIPEELTPSEANVLISCRRKLALDLFAGLLTGYTAVFAATWKFRFAFRSTLSVGASFAFAEWLCCKSVDSCLDQMLALNGSMLQKKVADIMLKRSSDFPISLRFMAKHFYSETVFDDSTSDTPKLRWRYRNIFSDNLIHCHKTLALDDFYLQGGVCHYDSYDKSQCESEILTDSKRTTLKTKQYLIKPGPDIMSEVDLLDCLFGYGAAVEEIDLPNTAKKPQGTHNRGHRRFHRRRRMHNYNVLSNSGHATAV